MPEVGNFPESRMREIFTSGSSRGEWVAPLAESPSLLLYRSLLIARPYHESTFRLLLLATASLVQTTN